MVTFGLMVKFRCRRARRYGSSTAPAEPVGVRTMVCRLARTLPAPAVRNLSNVRDQTPVIDLRALTRRVQEIAASVSSPKIFQQPRCLKKCCAKPQSTSRRNPIRLTVLGKDRELYTARCSFITDERSLVSARSAGPRILLAEW